MPDEGATVVITHRVREGQHERYEEWLNEIGPLCRLSPGHLHWQIIHPLGIIGLMVNAKLSLTRAFAVDLVFVPGDLAKALLAGVIAATVHRAFPALLAPRLVPVEAEPLR